jgi:hypothetical protein
MFPANLIFCSLDLGGANEKGDIPKRGENNHQLPEKPTRWGTSILGCEKLSVEKLP